ncbi:sulfotransferase family 2 domain-containing protein [Limibacillus halophilus]
MTEGSQSKRLRYGLFALFSKNYRYKLRMLDERPPWEGEGYSYDHIRSASILNPDTRAVFVPVLKAANTAVKHLMTPTDAGADSLNIHNRPADYGLVNLWRAGFTPDDLAAGRLRSFTVVRHPVARFWSAYRHLCRAEPQSILAGEIRAHCGLETQAAIAPEHLLDYIEGREELEREQHSRSQWSLCGQGRIPFAALGRVETLESFLPELVEKTLIAPDAPHRLARHNSSAGSSTSDEERRLERRIADCYQSDFDRFGYEA